MANYSTDTTRMVVILTRQRSRPAYVPEERANGGHVYYFKPYYKVYYNVDQAGEAVPVFEFWSATPGIINGASMDFAAPYPIVGFEIEETTPNGDVFYIQIPLGTVN